MSESKKERERVRERLLERVERERACESVREKEKEEERVADTKQRIGGGDKLIVRRRVVVSLHKDVGK